MRRAWSHARAARPRKELDAVPTSRYLRAAAAPRALEPPRSLMGPLPPPEPSVRLPPSRRREYRAWVEDQVEDFKERISRNELLSLADDVVSNLRVSPRGQYQFTEVLLAEAVDRHIFRLLKLPSYRVWLTTHPAPAPTPDPEPERTAQVERDPVPLPSAASF